MTRARDLSFEALVEVTGATVSSERGAINIALKQIREAEPELEDEDLALLIRLRAEKYKQVWPEIALTPTALAKHWSRIVAQEVLPVYPQPTGFVCFTCDGHKLVLVRLAASPNPRSPYEEWAPCPDCGAGQVAYWRWDGTRFSTPDPGEVRKMMQA